MPATAPTPSEAPHRHSPRGSWSRLPSRRRSPLSGTGGSSRGLSITKNARSTTTRGSRDPTTGGTDPRYQRLEATSALTTPTLKDVIA